MKQHRSVPLVRTLDVPQAARPSTPTIQRGILFSLMLTALHTLWEVGSFDMLVILGRTQFCPAKQEFGEHMQRRLARHAI